MSPHYTLEGILMSVFKIFLLNMLHHLYAVFYHSQWLPQFSISFVLLQPFEISVWVVSIVAGLFLQLLPKHYETKGETWVWEHKICLLHPGCNILLYCRHLCALSWFHKICAWVPSAKEWSWLIQAHSGWLQVNILITIQMMQDGWCRGGFQEVN